MTQRERELRDENQRLREANRRLQESGLALERDKLIRQLRAEIAWLLQENELLRASRNIMVHVFTLIAEILLVVLYWCIWLVWRVYCWTIWFR